MENLESNLNTESPQPVRSYKLLRIVAAAAVLLIVIAAVAISRSHPKPKTSVPYKSTYNPACLTPNQMALRHVATQAPACPAPK